jgi:hypothetical protein
MFKRSRYRRRSPGNQDNREETSGTGQLTLVPPFLGQTATVVAFLYFTGWMYHYYFYAFLGIAPNMVEATAQAYITFAFSVIYVEWKSFLALALGCGVAFAAGARCRPWLAQAIGLCVVVIAFLGSFLLCREDGRFRAFLVRQGMGVVPVRVALTREARKRAPRTLRRAIRDHQLWAVAQTEHVLYALFQPAPDGYPELPRGYVYAIPKESIALAEFTIRNSGP